MPTTGIEIIRAFKEDVEDFFPSDSNFTLNIVEEGWNPPRCKGVGANARIVLPTSYSEKRVDTYEEMVLMVVVLGHEAAHFLNRHNEYTDESSLETQAVEMWADYYGVKLALVAFTFGKNMQSLAESLRVEASMRFRINSFSSAFSTLASTYFSISHPSYPPATVRVATCIAGLLSFFEKIFSFQALQRGDANEYAISLKPETVVQRAICIQMWIYENSELLRLHKEPSTLTLNREQIRLISKIHRKIQSQQEAFFKGMKEVPAHWLNLGFDTPEEEQIINANARLSMLKSALENLGLDPSVIDYYENGGSHPGEG